MLLKKENINYSSLTEEQRKKLKKKKHAISYLQIIFGSIIYSIGVVWILRLGNFFSGGITGVAQLIVTFFEFFGTSKDVNTIINNNLGTIILLINIPLVLFSFRDISKKFAILTVFAILLQTIVMNLLSTFTISPLVILINNGSDTLKILNHEMTGSSVGLGLIDLIKSGTFNIARTSSNIALQNTFYQEMLPGTRFVIAIFGGIVSGLGAALCLKGGGSTGGMDIISNYLHLKKHKSFTKIQIIVDVIIIALSSVLSLENVLYTLVRFAVYMSVVDRVYTIYKTNRLEVITTMYEPIKLALLKNFSHSMTLYHSIGGYTGQEKDTLVIYASKYEVDSYINIIKSIDNHAFITITKAQIMKSNYIQKTITE